MMDGFRQDREAGNFFYLSGGRRKAVAVDQNGVLIARNALGNKYISIQTVASQLCNTTGSN
jgi:hypothetical protein